MLSPLDKETKNAKLILCKTHWCSFWGYQIISDYCIYEIRRGERAILLNEIEKKAPQLAERMTPAIVQEWEQDFASRFGDMSSLGLGRIGKNGKKPEPMHAFNFMIAQLRSLLALEKLLPNQIGWGLILKKFRTFPQRLMTLSKKFKNILV